MSPKKKSRNPQGRRRTANKTVPIVCVGASAGGLEAFTRLLETLPPDIGMAFVIIQHLDPSHPSALSPLLAKKSTLPVAEAREGTRVEANQAYVIPPDTVMTISKRVLRLATRASERKYMPIDHFMRSLAEDVGNRAIGVILSGTASDGTLGLESIKAAGGMTFAQDENSARYSGMPSSAKASGFVDFVLPPEGIARELARISGHPDFSPSASLNLESVGVPGSNDQFNAIFELLRKNTGLDFGSYKRTTVRRRIARRMSLQKLKSLDEYIALLQKNRVEVESLSQDLLIRVTTFFRDAEAFDALKKKVLPSLLKQLKGRDSIRIWVPGCSTGAEVYSIGMCLVEILEDAAPGIPCQIFATDISETAIEIARIGIYPETIKSEVSPARLRRFFTKTAEGFRISKSIRDLCIFARQDLTKDPPFSKLDLISCRNVLIYMNSDLQKRILPIFHYALRPGGFLMLGSAESAGSFSTLFTLADKKGKIYLKKSAGGDLRFEYPSSTPKAPALAADKRSKLPEMPATELDLFKEADRLMLTRYAPAGVLTNDELDVLQFRGNTTPYIEHAPGKPTINLLKLVKEELVFELRAAAEKARRLGVPARTRPVEDRQNGHPREVIIDVVPIESAQSKKPFLLVLFHESPLSPSGKGKSQLSISKTADTKLVQQLRRELAAVREELQ
jgi:two-component system CheB/CheR fusion protein